MTITGWTVNDAVSWCICFIHPIFGFWFLVIFGDDVTKIRKYYVIFVYILQGKMGKTEKNWKENHATKVTKIPKTKRRKYGMNETNVYQITCVLIKTLFNLTKNLFQKYN